MSTPFPVKALALAAGLGTRLKPFTNVVPKPLLPLFGPSVLEAVLGQMEAAGLRDVAVNTHHLAPAFDAFLTNHPFHLDIISSYEPDILGTGGAVAPLRQWLGDQHLLIYNADVIADLDLEALIAHHLQHKAVATMCLLAQGAAGKTPLYYADEQVKGIGGTAPAGSSAHSFACAHVLSPAFIARLPSPGFHNIIDTYQEVLRQGQKIAATLHHGFWFDMGSPDEYHIALHGVATTAACATYRHYLQDLAKRLGRSTPWQDKPLKTAMDRGVFWLSPQKPPAALDDLQHCIVLPEAPLARWAEFSHHIAGYGSLSALSV